MFGLAFDGTINLGTVVSAGALLLAAWGAYSSLMSKFFQYHAENRERLAKIEATMGAIPDIREEIRSIWEFLRPKSWRE